MGRWRISGKSFGWLGIAFVCCAGPTFVVQQYAGPPRPRESIAVIRVNGGGPKLATLDHEPLLIPEKDSRFHIEVLPGVHEIEVDDPNLGYDGATVRFVTEANKVYRIIVRTTMTPNAPGPTWTARAYEVDRSTDAELGPAASPSDAPPPIPAAPSVPDAGARDAAAE
jgi:hypothetical protein